MDMMPYLFVARTHGACVNTPNFDAFVAPCAFTPIGVETIMTDNVGVMLIGTLICDSEANTYVSDQALI